MTDKGKQTEIYNSFITSKVFQEELKGDHPDYSSATNNKASNVEELSIDFKKLTIMDASQAIKYIEESMKDSIQKKSDFSIQPPLEKDHEVCILGITLDDNFTNIKERTTGGPPLPHLYNPSEQKDCKLKPILRSNDNNQFTRLFHHMITEKMYQQVEIKKSSELELRTLHKIIYKSFKVVASKTSLFLVTQWTELEVEPTNKTHGRLGSWEELRKTIQNYKARNVIQIHNIEGGQSQFIHQIVTYDRFTSKVISQSKLWRLQEFQICFFKITSPASDNSQLLQYCQFDLNTLEEKLVWQEKIEADYYLRQIIAVVFQEEVKLADEGCPDDYVAILSIDSGVQYDIRNLNNFSETLAQENFELDAEIRIDIATFNQNLWMSSEIKNDVIIIDIVKLNISNEKQDSSNLKIWQESSNKQSLIEVNLKIQ